MEFLKQHVASHSRLVSRLLPDFWRNSGFHLLEARPAGRLRVTDDFLRAYYLRPEVHPVEESCDDERRIHAALMDDPRRAASATGSTRSRTRMRGTTTRSCCVSATGCSAPGTVEGCYTELCSRAAGRRAAAVHRPARARHPAQHPRRLRRSAAPARRRALLSRAEGHASATATRCSPTWRRWRCTPRATATAASAG